MSGEKDLPPSLEPNDIAVNGSTAEMRDLLRFLREENEANRKASREDAESSRKLLTDTVKIVSYPLTALIAVAAFLGLRDASSLEKHLISLENQRLEAFEASAKPSFLAEATKQVDQEVNKFEIDNIIQQDIAPKVSRQVDRQIAEKMAVFEKATSRATNKSIENIRKQELASAPLTALLGKDGFEEISASPGKPVSMTVYLRDFGQADLYPKGAYAVMGLIQTAVSTQDRQRTLDNLAVQLETKRRSGKGDVNVPQKLSWGEEMKLTFEGFRSLTPEEGAQLRKGEVPIYFIYLVQYERESGDATWAWFPLGSTNNLVTLKHPTINRPQGWP